MNILFWFYTIFIYVVLYINNFITYPIPNLMTILSTNERTINKQNIKETNKISDEDDLENLYIAPYELRNRLVDPVGRICENRKYYDGVSPYFHFFPAHKGKLYKIGDKFNFNNKCFQFNSIEILNITKRELIIKLVTNKPRETLCSDTYLFMTSSIQQVKFIFFKGEHIIRFTDLSETELLEISINGFRVFSFCQNIVYAFWSLLITGNFMSSNPPLSTQGYMQYLFAIPVEKIEDRHTLFLKNYANMEFPIRKGWEDKVIDVEPLIQSGDFFGGAMLSSGESCFILYTSGGQISHSAMALRVDGELFVVEMEDDGVVFLKYKDFLQNQINTHHSIAWFPLREEIRKRFNAEKAIEWVKKRVGTPYGMRNIVTANVDTVIGGQPDFLSLEHFMFSATYLEKANPELAKTLILDSLSKRISQENLTLVKLTEELVKRNLTFEEVLLMPESDDYLYYGEENWICSAMIANIWKIGGLFGDNEINSHEFTSRDITLLDIFDTNFTRPEICEKADPGLPYCMILGRHRLVINGYNTVPISSHMYERCPNRPPHYSRQKDC